MMRKKSKRAYAVGVFTMISALSTMVLSGANAVLISLFLVGVVMIWAGMYIDASASRRSHYVRM